MNDPQTAMLLTEGEWQDLSYVAQTFMLTFDKPPFASEDDFRRKVALCKRIVDAVDD